MIELKFIPPGQFYTARSVKVTSGSGNIYSLLPNNSCLIDESEINELNLKLDYHKTSFEIKANPFEKQYYLIYLKCRESLPLYFFDLLFKNCLAVKKVTEPQFNEPYKTNVLIENNKIIDKNSALFTSVLMLSALLLLFQFLILIVHPDFSPLTPTFYFLTGISTISMIYMRLGSRDLFYSQFYTRISAFLLYSFIFSFYTFISSSWLCYINIILIPFVVLKTLRLKK